MGAVVLNEEPWRPSFQGFGVVASRVGCDAEYV
jgi:hypothetical protein